jgi:NADH dehydrogenase
MFGRGKTLLQPADVEDVGEAVARLVQRTGREAITVEGGGPRVYSYEELLRTIARAANVRRILVPVPFAAWHALAGVAEMLPGAPVTRNQVELMQIDTVASPDVPGFTDLGISPRAMEEILQSILNRA